MTISVLASHTGIQRKTKSERSNEWFIKLNIYNFKTISVLVLAARDTAYGNLSSGQMTFQLIIYYNIY